MKNLLTAALLATLLIALTPRTVWGDTIADPVKGTTAGATVTGQTTVGEDIDRSTTFNVYYFTYCPWIPTAINNGGFGGYQAGTNNTVFGSAAYNFTFAGFPGGPAQNVANIPASDFTISNYAPWVVNNYTSGATGGVNNIVDPAGVNHAREYKDQDRGGANVVITYTPTLVSDPAGKVNFLQVYVLDPELCGCKDG